MAAGNIYRVTQDLEGNVVTGVLCTVTLAGTSTLAPLFADTNQTIVLPNPTTNNAQYGSMNVYVTEGEYDLQFVKAGFTFEPQYNVTVKDPLRGVTDIVGTANRVLVSPVGGVGTVTLSTPQDIAPDSLVQFARLGLATPANVNYVLDANGPSRMTDVGVTVRGFAETWGVGQGYAAGGLKLQVTGTAAIDDLGVQTRGFAATWGVGQGYATGGYKLQVTGTAAIDDLGVQTRGFAQAWGVGQGYPLGVQLEVTGSSKFNGPIGINGDAILNIAAHVIFNKNTQSGQLWQQTVNDTGTGQPVIINNALGTQIGSISSNASTVAYNTTSDGRLKHDVGNLTGELALIQALRPVGFRWNVDDSPGVGFLAHEVAAVVAGVITGEPDAMDDEGNIRPQQIDYAKLVPWLVGAIKTLTQRLEVVEDAAGV